MSYKTTLRLVRARAFERQAKKLFSSAELQDVESAIAIDPTYWPVVAHTGGCRKARVALGSRGRRGGARIVYFYRNDRGLLAFLYVYAKNEKTDLTVDDKAALRRLVAEIEEAAP
jgi:hypothetical protein